jgi:hypothetical protein
VFEGPGQGEALYTQRLFLRPDFEHVLAPVLDWLLTQEIWSEVVYRWLREALLQASDRSFR